MNRGHFILRRLAQMIPVLFGITLVVFALLQLIPGDPATTMLGLQARPEAVAALRHELGLDRPLWEQYLRYLGNVLTFDLGDSLKFKVSVASLLGDRLEVSLALIAYATVLMIALSVPLGIISALRTSVLEAMASDYVRTARAKGLRERAVVSTHVLRNALIPALTLLGLSIGYLLGGTVIVENVFSIPGAGKLLVDAITARDYPLVQSTTLVFAILVIAVNLLTDVIYTFLDPRVRL